jgi:hypothetical protein
MLKSLLATGAAVSAVVGVGYVGLHSLGEQAKKNLDELNNALEQSLPGKGKASAREVADWIERYRSGARGAECRRGRAGWDYVCVFRDADGRRRKFGVIVDSKQPSLMSPLVGAGEPVPSRGS